MARKVSVEDPPPELDAPLPEPIPPETHQRLAEGGNKPKQMPLESQDLGQSFAELHQDQPVKKTSRQQHQGKPRTFMMESLPEGSRDDGTEASSNLVQDPSRGRESLDVGVRKQYIYLQNE